MMGYANSVDPTNLFTTINVKITDYNKKIETVLSGYIQWVIFGTIQN